MSLGIFGLILIGCLIPVCAIEKTRGRTIFAAIVGLMLGLIIAGSDGVLVGPSHGLVDGVRAGLNAIGESIGGGR